MHFLYSLESFFCLTSDKKKTIQYYSLSNVSMLSRFCHIIAYCIAGSFGKKVLPGGWLTDQCTAKLQMPTKLLLHVFLVRLHIQCAFTCLSSGGADYNKANPLCLILVKFSGNAVLVKSCFIFIFFFRFALLG